MDEFWEVRQGLVDFGMGSGVEDGQMNVRFLGHPRLRFGAQIKIFMVIQDQLFGFLGFHKVKF